MEVEWFWKRAGLVTVWAGERWGIHLFPSRYHWQWGRADGWYDGPLYSFGLGPLLLVTYIEEPQP